MVSSVINDTILMTSNQWLNDYKITLLFYVYFSLLADKIEENWIGFSPEFQKKYTHSADRSQGKIRVGWVIRLLVRYPVTPLFNGPNDSQSLTRITTLGLLRPGLFILISQICYEISN